jgi:type I restriction enzyme M protein
MALSLNKPKLDNLAGDIWKSAERLRGKFKAYEYQGVILPIIVIRRLECVLLAWREAKRAEVLARRPKLTEKELAKLVKELELNPKQSPFSNKTDWTLRKVYEEDHALLEENFRKYHGQELSPTNYAVCQADLLIKNDRQAKVCYGNSLIPHDPHSRDPGDQWPEPKHRFDRMLSNPPFGVTWGGKDGYEIEARKLKKSRYQAGMPRVNDGALLFLQTMLAKIVPAEQGGSRIAILFNGSPLSNGDCGSSESEIRRWILENDWLDAIVMLPDQLFYNTGIFTYIWLLRNEKPASHRGRVMIVDARRQFEKEPKAFSFKRNRMTDAHRQWVEERYRDGWKPGYVDANVKIFKNDTNEKDFAYHKVSVVFWQTDERDKPAIISEQYEKAFTNANVAKEQEFYCRAPMLLAPKEKDQPVITFHVQLTAPDAGRCVTFTLIVNAAASFPKLFEKAARDAFAPEVKSLIKKLPKNADEKKAVKKFFQSLQTQVTWMHRHYVRDDEYIPHGEDIEEFLKREIAKPIIHWQDSPQLGYEILPNKYFYRYQPPTPAKDLLAEFWALERDAEKMLEGLANS